MTVYPTVDHRDLPQPGHPSASADTTVHWAACFRLSSPKKPMLLWSGEIFLLSRLFQQ